MVIVFLVFHFLLFLLFVFLTEQPLVGVAGVAVFFFRMPLMFLLWRRPVPDGSDLSRPAAVTNRSHCPTCLEGQI